MANRSGAAQAMSMPVTTVFFFSVLLFFLCIYLFFSLFCVIIIGLDLDEMEWMGLVD